jgi:hypothetical protein
VTRAEKDEAHRLFRHIDAIARELADRDSFELVDGTWVLPDWVWSDYMRRGDGDKYS